MESSGPATLYTLCDNIPRLSWLGERNTTKILFVTGTQTRTFQSRIPTQVLPRDQFLAEERAASERAASNNSATIPSPNTATPSPSTATPSPSTATTPTPNTQSSTHSHRNNKRDDSSLPKVPTCTLDIDTCNRLWAYSEGLEAEGDSELVDDRHLAHRLIVNDACLRVHQCGLGARNEIILFYWPEKVSVDVCALGGAGTAQTLASRTRPTKLPDAPIIIVTTAITFRGQELYGPFPDPPQTDRALEYLKTASIGPSIFRGNFTFTYPTVYIAHHAITASVSEFRSNVFNWSVYSETVVLDAGIIPLRSEDVSYVYTSWEREPTGLEFVTSVISSSYQRWYAYDKVTTRLNFGLLSDPVPASAYFKARPDCLGEISVTHCSTITDDSYRPQLHINASIWSRLMPSNVRCRVPALVDPAVAFSTVERNEGEDPVPDLPKIGNAPVAEATQHPAQKPDNPHHLGAMPGDRGSPPYPRPTGEPPRPGGTWGLGGGSTGSDVGEGRRYGEGDHGRRNGWDHWPGFMGHPSSDLGQIEDGGRKGWLGGGLHDWYRGGRDEFVQGGGGEIGDNRGHGPGRGSVRGGTNGGNAGSKDRHGGRLFTGAAAREVLPQGGMQAVALFGCIWLLFASFG